MARLRGRADGAGPALPSLDRVLREAGGWDAAFRASDVPSQREVLGTLLDQIAPHRLADGGYRLEITWKPTGILLRQLRAVLDRAA